MSLQRSSLQSVRGSEDDVFGLIEWFVIGNMPLAEVDDEITRTELRYGPTTSKPLVQEMLFLLQAKVNCEIKEKCLINLSLYSMDGLRGPITTLLFMPHTSMPFQILLWRHCFPFDPFFVMEYWE
jgi:hypothetical protein